MKTFVIKTVISHYELDDRANGCDPETSETFFDNSNFHLNKFDTLVDLVNALRKHYKSEPELNACDEPGRIDVQFMTRASGSDIAARQSTVDAWLKGEIERELYLCNMSFYVDIVISDEMLEL